MRVAPVPALALLLVASCSSETPSTAPDAAPGADVAEAGAADATPDRAAPVDASTDDRPDVWIWTDPVSLPVDVVDAAVGFDAVDAVAVGDAAPDDAADAAVGDAADAAVAVDAPDVVVGLDVVDAGADAPDVVVADRPDVVDVVRDTGPADAGPVTYDLNAPRGALEIIGLHRQTISGGGTRDCVTATTMLSCSVVSDELRFSFRQCSVDFVGSFSVPATTMRALSLAIGGAGHFAPDPRITIGTRPLGTTPRQSFHIQYARTVDGPAPGAVGIPGRTVDPSLGDIWILGCEVR